MRIKIVTHCYASQLPHFATCLKYQLSSITINGKDFEVEVNVCFNKDDLETVRVLRWYETHKAPNHILATFELPVERLGRRSIGRNIAAKWSKADIVWFTDVDHCFCDGIFGNLKELQWPEDTVMVYPKTIMIHKDHETGDKLLHITREYDNTYPIPMPLLDVNDFIEKQYSRAIGGVQIVQGGFAYEHGYLDGEEKWQRPVKKPFGDFRDDIAYRNFCTKYGSIKSVELPGVYRIRHTETTYQ